MAGWITLGIIIGVAIGASAGAAWGWMRRGRRFAHELDRAVVAARSAQERAAAAERLAEIGAMTGGLAHEIKNPLSTIGLNAQLLAEGLEDLPGDQPVDPATKQRLVRRLSSLRREAERLRGILQDFLAYAGELRLDQKPVELPRLIEELTDFFSPQAEQQGVRVRSALDGTMPPVLADAGLLKQALLNLLLNAVQAMQGAPAGSKELIVRTSMDAHGEASIHVADTGPGIAPEHRGSIFKPYFTTKAGGSGLGLPTTRRIIEAHRGRLTFHSEVGRGTEFIVTLPLAVPPAPGGQPTDGARSERVAS